MPSKERREFLEEARKNYQESLTSESVAGQYLTTTRGLSWANVNYFRLGVVNDPLPGHEEMRGMLSIPYLAPNGDTLTIRFRRLGEDGPKYRSMHSDTPRPYNTPALERHSLDFWITEGEPDTWILQQLGLPANGFGGANTWKSHFRHIYAQYRTVFVACDGDTAGKDFGKAIATSLPNARAIDMGTYEDDEGEHSHDVNSFFLMEGPEATLRKVGYVS